MGANCTCVDQVTSTEEVVCVTASKHKQSLSAQQRDWETAVGLESSRQSQIFSGRELDRELESERDLITVVNQPFGEFNATVPLETDCALRKIAAVRLLDNTLYRGEWNEKWERHGRGTEELPDGTVYVGYFKHDMRHGEGRLVLPSGDVIEGNFRRDQVHGFARVFKSDGSFYSGQFKWKDGSEYSGEFHNGLQEGFGKMEWPNGNCYEGQWTAGRMHGHGTFTWADGSVYKGEYVRNVKSGYGCLRSAGGNKYKGYWKRGVPHGRGCWTRVNSEGTATVQKGTWKNGIFQA